MTQDANPRGSSLGPAMPQDDEVAALAAQLGLTTADAQVAWDTVRHGLAARRDTEPGAEGEGSEAAMPERLDVGGLLDLLGGGKEPDLAETAKDELVKAVAKKLGIDPAQASAVVDKILKAMEKPAPRRRRKKPAKKTPRKTAAKRKRPAAGSSSSRPKKPATASGAKKRPKAKPSSASAASAATQSAGSNARPKRKKRPAGAKPAAGPSTSKPRKRSTTRADTAVSEATQ